MTVALLKVISPAVVVRPKIVVVDVSVAPVAVISRPATATNFAPVRVEEPANKSLPASTESVPVFSALTVALVNVILPNVVFKVKAATSAVSAPVVVSFAPVASILVPAVALSVPEVKTPFWATVDLRFMVVPDVNVVAPVTVAFASCAFNVSSVAVTLKEPAVIVLPETFTSDLPVIVPTVCAVTVALLKVISPAVVVRPKIVVVDVSVAPVAVISRPATATNFAPVRVEEPANKSLPASTESVPVFSALTVALVNVILPNVVFKVKAATSAVSAPVVVSFAPVASMLVPAVALSVPEVKTPLLAAVDLRFIVVPDVKVAAFVTVVTAS